MMMNSTAINNPPLGQKCLHFTERSARGESTAIRMNTHHRVVVTRRTEGELRLRYSPIEPAGGIGRTTVAP